MTFTLPVAEESAVRAVSTGPRSAARPGKRVLVVDDDPHTLQHVRATLEEAGYLAVLTGVPEEVPGLLNTERPDLVLLDLMLPGTDGLQLMEDIPRLHEVPVIFLSACGREEIIAAALGKGCADYMVKPFAPRELLARIGAALRGRPGRAKVFELGDLAIHYDERRATLAGMPLELSVTQYDLLRELAVNAGRVVTHEALLGRVWKGNDSRDTRRVRAVIQNLRAKLGDDPFRPSYIFTVFGVGYRMAKPKRV